MVGCVSKGKLEGVYKILYESEVWIKVESKDKSVELVLYFSLFSLK